MSETAATDRRGGSDSGVDRFVLGGRQRRLGIVVVTVAAAASESGCSYHGSIEIYMHFSWI
nr:hypothetical protein Iba_chr10cCG8420 [Ipomoea batatas]